MIELCHHRTPHWLNTRTRIGRLTTPQWIAVSLSFAIGGLVYWGLSTLHTPSGLDTAFLFGRIVVSGFVAGALAALFYGLADDCREPVEQRSQGVTYPFRRHAYVYLLSKQSNCAAGACLCQEGQRRRSSTCSLPRRVAQRPLAPALIATRPLRTLPPLDRCSPGLCSPAAPFTPGRTPDNPADHTSAEVRSRIKRGYTASFTLNSVSSRSFCIPTEDMPLYVYPEARDGLPA